MPRHAKRTRLQVDERRNQLLEVGMDLFSRQSFDELGIDDVARVAGVSKGLIYHYFENKRGFYIACLSTSAERLLKDTETAPDEDLLAQLRAGLEAYLSYVEAHARAFITLFRGGVGFDEEAAEIIEATRWQIVDRMRSRLELELDQALLKSALRGYLGFVEAAVLDWVGRHGIERSQLLDLLMEMLNTTIRTVLRSSAPRSRPDAASKAEVAGREH
jgi:AcrR family transcriptional regulator